MTKKIKIITQDGSRIYKMQHIDMKWKVAIWQARALEPIGEGRTNDDAMAIIRDHATAHFGSVQRVNIESTEA